MSQPTVVPVHLPPIHRHTLDNGMRLIVAPRHDLPLVALELLVEGGSSVDPKGARGAMALAASLLTRGSASRAPGEVDRLMEGVGGRLDARATRDHLVVSAGVLAENLELALREMGELVARPSFDPREIETARGRAVADLEQSKDDPPVLASRSLLGAFLPEGHPYATPAIGRIADLRRMDREAIRACYEREVTPGRAILIVVGDVDPDAAFALAEEAFGAWEAGAKSGAPVAGGVEARPLAGRRIRIVPKDEATQVQVRWVGAAPLVRQDPLYFPATVASAAFGGGFTSRLVDEIRVRRGLSYSVGSGFLLLRHAGFYTFSSFTKNESVGELLRVALGEAAKAREGGFSEEETERARRYLAGLYPLGLETNEQIALAIAELEIHGLPETWVPNYRRNLLEVSRADAHRAAASYFFPGPEEALVLVGQEEAIAAALAAEGIEGEVEVLPLDEAV